MSSRSSGVTNVRFRRSMMLRVFPSHTCSMSLMACAFAMSGGSLASICLSVRAPSWICWDMRDELVEELLLTGNQTEADHVTSTTSGS